MKLFVLSTICIVCLFSFQSLFSQEEVEVTSREAKKKVVPGLRVGITTSNVYDREGDNFVAQSKNGFSGGGYLALPLGSLLGIQPELILQQKGFEGTGSIEGEQYLINRTTTHLDIPLQLMVKPFKWFTFLIGPQYSFVLKQTDSYNFGSSKQTSQSQLTNINEQKSLVGTLTGVDLNFNHIVLSFRSGWDLSSNRSSGFSYAPRYRNRWIQWTLGYRFY